MRDMRYALLLVVIFCFGCASRIKIPTDEIEQLRNAIIQNDEASVLQLIGETPFKKSNSFGDSITKLFSPGIDWTWEEDAYQILDLAILGKTKKDPHPIEGGCKPGIVKILMDAELPPRQYDLTNATLKACPEVVGILAEKVDNKALIKSTDKFKNHLFYTDASQLPLYILTVDKFQSMLQMRCASTAASGICSKSNEFNQYPAWVRQKIAKRESRIEGVARRVSEVTSKHGIGFCENPNIYNVLYSPFRAPIEKNCIYSVENRYQVIQAVKGGVLASLINPNKYETQRVFFIRGKMNYVDNERISHIYVKSSGTFSYTNTLGARATVSAFTYLGEGK